MGQNQSQKSPIKVNKFPPPPPFFASVSKKEATKTDDENAVDMRYVTLALWKRRDDRDFISMMCDKLSNLIDKKPVLDQVEFYLPQLAHMVLHLEEFPIVAIEQFVMLVSQSSVHFALQFFWMIYASLDENRPKRNGDSKVFMRCAQLLLTLEQCLVYGSPVAMQAEELFAKNSISRLEREKILMADRRFFAAQNTSLVDSSLEGEASPQGWIMKKGGGTSLMGRRNWKQRWCRIERRILFLYNRETDIHARSAIPLDGVQVLHIKNPRHANYFEVYHKYTNAKYKFSALTEEDLTYWSEKIKEAATAPIPPQISPTKAGPAKTLADMSEAMRTFILQDDGQISPVKRTASQSSFGDSNDGDEEMTQQSLDVTNANSSCITPTSAISSDTDGDSEGMHTLEFTPPNGERHRRPSITRSLLDSNEQRRYDFFEEERNFVKAITDVCEELRHIDQPKRKPAFVKKMKSLVIPQGLFIPMCKSTDVFHRVIKPCPDEGHVFSTHERVPCLMCFEVLQDEQKNDVSTALYKSLYGGAYSLSRRDSEKALSIPENNNAPQNTNLIEKSLNESFEFKAKVKRVFGEIWPEKIKRIKDLSENRHLPGWNLTSIIAKSNDDLRQEVFVMQLIWFFHDIFAFEGLPLKLHPYKILSTGASTGLIEVIRNANSLDGIKKSEGFTTLTEHFKYLYGGPNDELFKEAQKNFIHSLAAYSVVCYILSIKDRHNGNIMIDINGYVVHIDFGFLLGRAPGGSFSFETAPFKLTAEMVDVMGGRDSDEFKYFREMCIKGALAARKYAETIYYLVEIMSFKSKFPCFQGSISAILGALREKLFLNIPEERVGPTMDLLIDKSYDHFGTNQYDQFQVYTNGIAR